MRRLLLPVLLAGAAGMVLPGLAAPLSIVPLREMLHLDGQGGVTGSHANLIFAVDSGATVKVRFRAYPDAPWHVATCEHLLRMQPSDFVSCFVAPHLGTDVVPGIALPGLEGDVWTFPNQATAPTPWHTLVLSSDGTASELVADWNGGGVATLTREVEMFWFASGT